MREARKMVALGAAAIVMTAALLGCGGKANENPGDAAKADAAPPAQDHANPAPPANPPADQAANPAGDQNDQYDPATAAGAVKGIPAPTNTGNIEAVANYFSEMPGFDTEALGEHGKAKFLHRVNSELCSCGCKNQTLAFCLVNDPKCPVIKGLVQSVYDEVKSGK